MYLMLPNWTMVDLVLPLYKAMSDLMVFLRGVMYLMLPLLQGGSGLEQRLVVVVDHVRVRLWGDPLRDLTEQLVHHGVRKVVGEHVEHEAVGAGELQVVKTPGTHLPHQDRPGEIWNHDPGESVDQAEHGDPDEGEPPEPEDEEVLLVEQVVGEDAQVVRPVDRSGGGADSDVACHLCGEQLTHGVVGEILALRPHVLHAPHVVQYVLAVAPELVQQQRVGDEEGEDDHAHVEELAEAEVEVVLGVSRAEVQEVLGDHSRFSSGAEEVPHQAVLKEVPPHTARELGEAEAECEKEGQPEVVGGHRGILLALNPALVDEATSGLALQVLPDVGSSMDPAVRPGILVASLADNCSPVKMVFEEDEQQSEHYDEG